ncbi:hypothetical protein TKK_0012558 [Trichogramma kaykai]|uniref:Regulator of G-protein signaling loco n=1 Tax=Trichogramma kaykai TaxID=54128 RepID=A0ABD2WLN1_9HYME
MPQQLEHQFQHQSRRPKKRVNYGSRSIELARGSSGYGFTISGQQPCILSCIVPDSPADLAGLRSGDYLIAVNGRGVRRAAHDDVVKFIARSNGILKLQIADNYYSDSSEDEESISKIRAKPRYRSKSNHATSSSDFTVPSLPQCRVAKVVRDLQSGAMFGSTYPNNTKPSSSCSNLPHRWSMSSQLPLPPPPAVRRHDSEKIVHRAVLGYLGSLEIPSHLQSVSMVSLVKKCIKRVKAEQRNPSTVLLTIHVANIKLSNLEGRVIAEYPSSRVIYCNYYSNEDRLHCGILTKTGASNSNIDSSSDTNSCHVFRVLSNLTPHKTHLSTSAVFDFMCTKANERNDACQEFPSSCDGIIGAIQTLYAGDANEPEACNLFDNRRSQPSPQPSNLSSSTIHSSNSDSGIGFKDECGSHEEKSIVVSSLERKIKDPNVSKLTVRTLSNPRWSDFTRPETPSSDEHDEHDDRRHNHHNRRRRSHLEGPSPSSRNRRTSRRHQHQHHHTRYSSGGEGSIVSCPAVPSGPRSQRQKQLAAANVAGLVRSPRYTSTLSVGTLRTHDYPNSSSSKARNHHSANQWNLSSQVNILDRLSPKVYTNGMKIQGYSMENLKTSPSSKSQFEFSSFPRNNDVAAANVKSPRPWGSMQEIRQVNDSEPDIGTLSTHGSTESCNKPVERGVHTWSTSFEKLLEDPMGLKTFAKFLKKEISHENIYFWAACQRYSSTSDVATRKKLAQQIYQRHLANNGPEPVNIDSTVASRITPESIHIASNDLFAQAQKQIFNLMKFDSYPRFLRSDEYRKCLESGCDDEDNSVEDNDLLLSSSSSTKLKKSVSDAEDRCRKSILPWNRKNRSKSKDRGESEYNKTPNRGEKIYKSFSTIQRENDGNIEEDGASISSSRSSLASWDLALRQSFTKHSASSYEGQSNEIQENVVANCAGLCRVILPDGSTTVITTNHSDSVKDVLTRLLEKRALRYSNYDVFMLATNEIVNLKYPSSVLSSQEVEVVPTKIIKIDLPSRRVISVVAHKGKTLKDVLKPLLNKYGLKLDLITIWADGHPITLDIQARDAPARLTLTSNNNKDTIDDAFLFKTPEVPKGQSSLDEITNKVFEELRVGKVNKKSDTDNGSCKSDDQKSEGSSIRSGKFFSRDSTLYIRKKAKSKSSNLSEKSGSECGNDDGNKTQTPLIAKWRNGVKLQLPSRFDGDGKNLYEDLKRAQRLRLEDQRGTEINFELPDFLKNKENEKTPDSKKSRKTNTTLKSSEHSKFYEAEEERPFLESSFNDSASLDGTIIEANRTVVENGKSSILNNSHEDASQISPSKLSKPPPLPPKPKSLSNSVRSNVLPSRPFQRVANFDKKPI